MSRTHQIRETLPVWPVKKIAWLFDMIGSGTTPDSNKVEFYEDGVIPWVNTAELRDNVIQSTNKFVTERALEQFSALTIFPRGTLLIALYGATIGRLGILDMEATTNQACCGMACPKGVDIQFVFYWLLSQRENIITLASGGGQPNISQETVKQLRLSVSPLVEQRRIVAYLDRETAHLYELRTEKEKFLELLELKRTAIIAHSVTRGLDENAPLKPSGIDWLGDVPEHWEVKKIAWLFDLIASGTTPTAGKAEFYDDGITPWVTTGELRDKEIKSTLKCVTPLAMEQFTSLTLFPPGTLLMALYGATIGRLGILEIEAVSNQACCGMAYPKGVDVSFMFYWLLSQRENIIIMASGGGQPNISQEIVRQIRVPVPPLVEQRAIITHLEQVLQEIDELKGALLDSLNLLSQRRAALITEAVTGRMDLTA